MDPPIAQSFDRLTWTGPEITVDFDARTLLLGSIDSNGPVEVYDEPQDCSTTWLE